MTTTHKISNALRTASEQQKESALREAVQALQSLSQAVERAIPACKESPYGVHFNARQLAAMFEQRRGQYTAALDSILGHLTKV